MASGKWQVSESRVAVRTVGGGRPVGTVGQRARARTCVAKWHNTIAKSVGHSTHTSNFSHRGGYHNGARASNLGFQMEA